MFYQSLRTCHSKFTKFFNCRRDDSFGKLFLSNAAEPCFFASLLILQAHQELHGIGIVRKIGQCGSLCLSKGYISTANNALYVAVVLQGG
jgi:hypothetical protein